MAMLGGRRGCVLLLAADLYRALARRGGRPASIAGAIAARSSARKRPGELRVVMLGGSTVFGYGVAWDESIARYLERAAECDAAGSRSSISASTTRAPIVPADPS